MRRLLIMAGLLGLLARPASAWRPHAWIYLDWPWAFETVGGDWHWLATDSVQWVHGFPPADGWRRLQDSALAQGWTYLSWPFAFCPQNNAWHYFNESTPPWCVNLRTGRWTRFGEADPLLDLEALRAYWRSHSYLGLLMDGGQLPAPVDDVSIELLARAAPDECFSGIPPLAPPLPPNPALTPPPCSAGQPKVNQAYVWGLAEAEDRLWFGTAANVHCLVLGGYLGITNPIQTESFVAEFGHSFYAQAMGLPATLGDWRPPRVFRYDPDTRQLDPRDSEALLPPGDRQRLRTTLGLRSAGAWPGSPEHPQSLVLLAGPALATAGGLNFFAYDARTGALLASATQPAFNNIRKWLLHDGALYTAVGLSAGGGAVLRWREDPADPDWPFAFEEIARLDSPGVELAVHENRLFVSTWPGRELSGGQSLAALWMSPPIPPEGLTSASAADWQRVWRASDYEPDPITAATYGGGALASFNGLLYWGTMHVPALALAAHRRAHDLPDADDASMLAALATHRAIAVFRGRNFGSPDSPPVIELLYGAAALPVYSPAAGGWTLAPNAMGGAEPLFGPMGLGNPFNNYAWTLEPFRHQLYLGTMDFSYLVFDLLPLFLSPAELFQFRLDLLVHHLHPDDFFGADLFRFPDADTPAEAVSRQGAGNPASYGIRTMLPTDDRLFLGMANPMNLLADGLPDAPQGGWELRALAPSPPPLHEIWSRRSDSNR